MINEHLVIISDQSDKLTRTTYTAIISAVQTAKIFLDQLVLSQNISSYFDKYHFKTHQSVLFSTLDVTDSLGQDKFSLATPEQNLI